MQENLFHIQTLLIGNSMIYQLYECVKVKDEEMKLKPRQGVRE
jgi:hypothetical protein